MGPCESTLAIRLPTSRAYWNLRAEQVMDKVFDQEALNPTRANHLIPVDVDVHEPPPAPPTPPAAKPAPSPAATSSTSWLLLIVSGIAVAGTVNSGWLISRLMVERLQAEVSTPAEPEPEPQLSPPPPEPEWMTSLEPPAPPISPRLALSPVAPEPLPMLSPMPQLTGVVQGPGGNSSAIFQLGTTSLSAGIGENIGNSGWRLDSISGVGAVISQHGPQRTLSVGGLC